MKVPQEQYIRFEPLKKLKNLFIRPELMVSIDKIGILNAHY